MKALFSAFYSHLDTAGIGLVSELFDADEPHHPRGEFSHAWNVAEILRVYFEEFLNREESLTSLSSVETSLKG